MAMLTVAMLATLIVIGKAAGVAGACRACLTYRLQPLLFAGGRKSRIRLFGTVGKRYLLP